MAFGSRLVCRLRFRLTDSVATPILAGLRSLVGVEDRLDEQVGELAGIGDGGVELALAEAGLVGQLDDRAVVRVAAGDQDVADAGLLGDLLADDLHHRLGRPAAEVDADERDLVVARRDDDRLGHERVERALERACRAGHHSPTSGCRRAA